MERRSQTDGMERDEYDAGFVLARRQTDGVLPVCREVVVVVVFGLFIAAAELRLPSLALIPRTPRARVGPRALTRAPFFHDREPITIPVRFARLNDPRHRA